MKHVEIFTDGACQNNPGKGGWACVLKFGQARKELSGFEADTTNNRMELTAVIQSLLALNEPCEVTLTTDLEVIASLTKSNAELSTNRSRTE